jgi:glycogen(starch) synthase
VESTTPYLACADLFALPSREEQSGSLAVIEALQDGLPVVASGVDGLLEDLTDGEDALLVPPGNAAALAAALERLLGDPGLRRRLGGCGRATFEARFSPEAVAGALRDLYGGLGIEP